MVMNKTVQSGDLQEEKLIKEQVTPQDAVDFLNELLKLDKKAIASLIEQRVPCNDALANHESVQVQKYPGDSQPVVGLLGIIGGLFGADKQHWSAICAIYDEKTDELLGFDLTINYKKKGD